MHSKGGIPVANRVYLMNHALNQPTAAGETEDACMLGANYQLPILWLAMFDINDLHTVAVPCINDNGDKFDAQVPTLMSSVEKTAHTYGARCSALTAKLGVENALYLSEWSEFLATGLTAPTLQLDLIELWMMYENPADFDLDLRSWIVGIDNFAHPGWANLCEQANLGDKSVSRYGIRGYPWGVNLDWVK